MKKYLFMAVAAMFCFSGCSDNDDPDPVIDPVDSTKGVFVVNAGVMGTSSGTLSYLNLEDNVILNNAFFEVNGQYIGDTFNDGIVFGDNIYLAVNGSNVIQVLDCNTLKLKKTITLDNEKSGPRRLAGLDNYVYVTLFSGYLAKIDTKTLNVTGTIEVGPNPEAVVVYNKQLYVAVSDGINSANDFADACVAVVDPVKMTVTKKISAGKNLTDLATDGEKLFVLSSGEYELTTWKQINYGVREIKGDKVSDILFAATSMALNAGTLYYIDNGYLADAVSYGRYDIRSGAVSSWISGAEVKFPAGFGVDRVTGDAYILSNNMGEGGFADYTSPGYMVRYDAEGGYVGKYDVGVCPTRVFFSYE